MIGLQQPIRAPPRRLKIMARQEPALEQHHQGLQNEDIAIACVAWFIEVSPARSSSVVRLQATGVSFPYVAMSSSDEGARKGGSSGDRAQTGSCSASARKNTRGAGSFRPARMKLLPRSAAMVSTCSSETSTEPPGSRFAARNISPVSSDRPCAARFRTPIAVTRLAPR
jgi:hypothetical protein